MAVKEYCAYVFASNWVYRGHPGDLERGRAVAVDAPRHAWCGDYLNIRPIDGVRVRIHEFRPQASKAGVFVGPGTVGGVRYKTGFMALLQTEVESAATRERRSIGSSTFKA